MPSEEQRTYKGLKSNISDAIKESCPAMDAIIYKIADEVGQIQTVTVEPGVEIAQGLSAIIDAMVQNCVQSGYDLSIISQGILIGSFRSSRSVKLEAHKTIHLLVKEILQSVFKYKGDAKQMINGLLAGTCIFAKEQKLNIRESLIVTVESILLTAKRIDPQFIEEIKTHIPKEYNGLKVKP